MGRAIILWRTGEHGTIGTDGRDEWDEHHFSTSLLVFFGLDNILYLSYYPSYQILSLFN